MALAQTKIYTEDDYYNLPEDVRAELIDGQFYDMSAPSRIHQEILGGLYFTIRQYIREKGGSCKAYPAPFAVKLFADDKTIVEPDISVICDSDRLTDRGCTGAPDWIIEIVSPGNRKMDYIKKNSLYSDAGVREYWIVDPDKQRTMIYRYDGDDAPVMIPFEQPASVGIYDDLQITVAELIALNG